MLTHTHTHKLIYWLPGGGKFYLIYTLLVAPKATNTFLSPSSLPPSLSLSVSPSLPPSLCLSLSLSLKVTGSRPYTTPASVRTGSHSSLVTAGTNGLVTPVKDLFGVKETKQNSTHSSGNNNDHDCIIQ